MKTAVGFWDAVFGKRIDLETTLPNGTVKTVKVTEKWLVQMESEGRIRQTSSLGGANQVDPLLERAEKLVQAARANAITIFTPLLDRFPLLRQVDVGHSDFILSIAGVFMAATRLNNLRLGGDREEKLMKIVAGRLEQWRADGIRGFEDCKELFEGEFDRLTSAGHEPRFVASDAVGKWIVLNILGRPPRTNEECMLVRVTGVAVTHTFFDWWEN